MSRKKLKLGITKIVTMFEFGLLNNKEERRIFYYETAAY